MLLNFWATIIKKLFSLSFHLFFSIRLKNLIRQVGQLQLIAGVKWVTDLNCIGFAIDVCNFTLLNQIINGSTFSTFLPNMRGDIYAWHNERPDAIKLRNAQSVSADIVC